VSHMVFGAVAATAVAALVLVLLVRLALRAHGRGPAHGNKPGSGTVLRVVGRTVQLLTRAGVRLGPVMLLTVAGRTTGAPRTNPVDVFVRDGRYWLVATHTADAHWVRNLRAAGTGTCAAVAVRTPSPRYNCPRWTLPWCSRRSSARA